MAMIKCRECGHEISSMAVACPHCGAKTRFGEQENEKKALSISTMILIGLSIIGTIIFLSGFITMMDDISNYGNGWGIGYNYKLPWTEHEIGVIMRMVLGLAFDFGGVSGIIKASKSVK